MYKIEIEIPEENNALAQAVAERIRRELPDRNVRVLREMLVKPSAE